MQRQRRVNMVLPRVPPRASNCVINYVHQHWLRLKRLHCQSWRHGTSDLPWNLAHDMAKTPSLFQCRKLRKPQSHVNQATSEYMWQGSQKIISCFSAKAKYLHLYIVLLQSFRQIVLTSLQHVRSKRYCIVYHDQWSIANGRRFIQKSRAMYRCAGLLLPGYPPAPPDAFALAGELVHALFDRCHDLPLHAQHGGQHVPLGAAFLWLYYLHGKRETHTHTSGEPLVLSWQIICLFIPGISIQITKWNPAS